MRILIFALIVWSLAMIAAGWQIRTRFDREILAKAGRVLLERRAQ